MNSVGLENIRNVIARTKIRKELLEEEKQALKESICKAKKEIVRTEKAQAIIQEVSKSLQDQIKICVEDIVDDALYSVYGERYNFNLDIAVKRGKTECDIYLEKNGRKMYPTKSNGGGIVDVIGFALRIISWNLQFKDKNNSMVLDEPFKWLSKDLHEKASLLIKSLSEKLSIQFIIASHSEDIKIEANTVFAIENKKGESKII